MLKAARSLRDLPAHPIVYSGPYIANMSAHVPLIPDSWSIASRIKVMVETPITDAQAVVRAGMYGFDASAPQHSAVP